jgi:hypothetical protein
LVQLGDVLVVDRVEFQIASRIGHDLIEGPRSASCFIVETLKVKGMNGLSGALREVWEAFSVIDLFLLNALTIVTRVHRHQPRFRLPRSAAEPDLLGAAAR